MCTYSAKFKQIGAGEENKLIITREVDYALRILRTLSSGKMHTTSEICDTEVISLQFAYKITKKLESAGIVEILRGSSGGCRLAADLSKLSLYDLMNIMKARESLNACLCPGYACNWRSAHNSICNIHNNLEAIQEKIYEEYKKHSIASIIGTNIDKKVQILI